MATSHSTSISDAPSHDLDAGIPQNDGSDDTGAQGVMKRAVQSAHAAVDSVARKVESAVDRFRTGAANTTATVQDGANQIAQIETQMVDSVRTTVRSHPLLALGLALAAGVLLSRMISSR